MKFEDLKDGMEVKVIALKLAVSRGRMLFEGDRLLVVHVSDLITKLKHSSIPSVIALCNPERARCEVDRLTQEWCDHTLTVLDSISPVNN